MTFTRTDSIAAQVLVIESDPLMLHTLGAVLSAQGHRATLARTEEVAFSVIAEHQFDAIVLSITSLEPGCRFAKRLKSNDSTRDVPIVFLVPELTPCWTQELAASGGVYSMLKPVDPHALVDLIDRVLWMPHVAKGRLGTPNTQYASQLDWMTLES